MTHATQSLWSVSGRSHQVVWLTVGCLEGLPANKGSLVGAPTPPSFQGLGIHVPLGLGAWGSCWCPEEEQMSTASHKTQQRLNSQSKRWNSKLTTDSCPLLTSLAAKNKAEVVSDH